jgi:hypothetical protein
MYRQLPRLRQSVRRLIGSASALGFQSLGSAPGSVTVGGTLTSAGLPIAGATVEVERRSTTRGPSIVGTATTDANGGWAVTVALPSNAALRAVYRGDGIHSAVVSAGVSAAVAPQIALTAAAQQAPPGSVIPFTGSVTPAKPRLVIVIAKQQLDGTFATIRTIALRPEDDGTFARSIGFPESGQYQIVAHTSADDANALGTSAPVAITIA